MNKLLWVYPKTAKKQHLKVSSARALKDGTQLKSSVVCQLWRLTRNKMRVM